MQEIPLPNRDVPTPKGFPPALKFKVWIPVPINQRPSLIFHDCSPFPRYPAPHFPSPPRHFTVNHTTEKKNAYS